jgi:hypothetical protein
MPQDYVPVTVAGFYSWQQTFITYATANLSRWQLGFTALPAALLAQQVDYQSKYALSEDPSTRTKMHVEGRQKIQKEYTKVLRAFVKKYLLYNELVTTEDRVAMGLKVYDTIRTRPPKPRTWPVGRVNTALHMRHGIHVTDSEHEGRGLPPDVHGFEVWRKVGGAEPVDDAEFSYAGFSSTSYLELDYPLADSGKTVRYRFRWVNTHNEPGPWSEGITEAIIP